MSVNRPVQVFIERLWKLDASIRSAFEKNELEDLDVLIKEYAAITEDAALVSFQSNYYFQQGEYEQSEKVVKQGLKKYPFSFDLNINLGIVCEIQNRWSEALFAYSRALKYAGEEQKATAHDFLERVIATLKQQYANEEAQLMLRINEAKRILNESDSRFFPLDSDSQSLIRQLVEVDNCESYMTNMYGTNLINDVDESSFYFHKTETIHGNIEFQDKEFLIESPSLIPVSLLIPEVTIIFELNEKNYSFVQKDLPQNRFHYLRFNEQGTLKIKSDQPVFIGKQIKIEDPPLPKKLVLNLFIDGIALNFIQEYGLENVMPYSHAYFQDGVSLKRCYATSEWTFPSVATMFTGKYTTNHGVFHPDFNFSFTENSKLLSEYMKEAGYFTAHIGGDWRVTPAHGYHKGFDRIVYQMAGAEFDCRQIVSEAIEHLEAFKHKNHFLWLSISDTHAVPDEIDGNLMLQTKIDISERVNRNKKGKTTVLTGYDENKKHKYMLEIQRIDLFLQNLYFYLQQNYKDEEILVVLTSDHGQTFLEDSQFLLHENRRRVPLLIKGATVDREKTEELLELTDLLPILLKNIGMEIPTDIDGQLPAAFGGNQAREYVYTEAIHPNQSYKAVLSDMQHIFYFETELSIQNDGLIPFGTYSTALINAETKQEEGMVFKEKSTFYEEVVLNHIKRHIKLS